jgi:hypothetical protein
MLMIPLTFVARLFTKSGTTARKTASTALQTNVFLSTVSLLPIPGIDGGPILKWSLVDKGYTVEEADLAVQKVNGPLSGLLGLFCIWAFSNGKRLLGIFSGLLAVISFSVFRGWIKEEEITQ